MISYIVERILDIIYPRRCAICDRTIEAKAFVCYECEKKIKVITGNTCMKCGKKVSADNVYCYDCKRRKRDYDKGFAVFEYDAINQSLYRFKYKERPEYARFYAFQTNKLLGDTLRRLQIEAFIPVPIHKRRYKKRGYNQAEEYARELSKLCDIPVANDIVARQKNTVPLKKLKGVDREKNLKNAFKLVQNDVKFRRVCVVDDIYTTGATIDALARILKANGIREVYFVTIAIGVGL